MRVWEGADVRVCHMRSEAGVAAVRLISVSIAIAVAMAIV